ncbi:MAG TPA: GTPase [Phycisphaerales bacterium]|nr:GTPase [Phycisphaerales bacterium]
MNPGDTIVAPASPPGRSARAIVRLSGPLAFAPLGGPRPRGIAPAVLRLGGLEVPVLAAALPSPNSYTGEDTLELQLPGNPALVERVLHAITSIEGIRLATPGEFTARAYLAGRLTLSQAEGVAATIAATTREQLDAAADLLGGRTGERYRAWAEELATLLALVEAGIDFTDQEDVVAIAAPTLSTRLTTLAQQLTQHLGGVGEHGGTVPRVVLVGRPNAGKSTLFNALLGRRRAVTSPEAGTTRDVLSEELDLSREVPGAGAVMLQDLAGMEDTPSRPDQHAAREAVCAADLLLWCDPSGHFDAAPLNLPMKPILRVRTFGDRPPATGTREDVAVCALDGWHLDTLRRAVADAATTAHAASVAALLPRHRRAMLAALGRLYEAIALSADAERLEEPEVIALTLRLALDEVGELAGQISPDEVLGRVFATFCVGK